MWKRHIDLPTKSIIFDRCSCTMACVPLMTIWTRRYRILPYKAGTIFILPKVFNLLCAADTWRHPRRAHRLHLQHCQEQSFFRRVSQPLHHLRETDVHRVHRRVKVSPLRDASEDLGIPNFGQLLRAQIDEDCGHGVSGLVPQYHLNILIDSILIKLQNGLLFYHPPFHCPTLVEHLERDCKVEYTHANEGIMPDSHNIRVQYTDSDLDNTVQG